MGGVSDFLFGSDSKTSQYDSLRPEWDYQKTAREALTNALSGSFNQGNTSANTASANLSSLANTYSPENMVQLQEQVLADNTNKGIGSVMNNLAGKGVLNSSVTQNALTGIGTNANDQILGNYSNDINQAASLNQAAYNAADNLQSGYEDLYKLWLAAQTGTPLQTVQEGGSSGLLGTGLSAYINARYGKK